MKNKKIEKIQFLVSYNLHNNLISELSDASLWQQE